MITAAPDMSACGRRALEMITDGMIVGLGTGHAATAFIEALGERVRQGLRVRGIPTSKDSERLAKQLQIPLTNFEEVDAIDIDVDGADEVDPLGNLIKGYGGALVREKIVAAASRKLVIVVGAEKLVPALGSHGRLPVEVVPFASAPCRRRLTELGFTPTPRLHDGRIFITDNGNYILDCQVPPLERPGEVEQAIRAIPGVVGTGLFLGMANVILIQHGDTVEERQL